MGELVTKKSNNGVKENKMCSNFISLLLEENPDSIQMFYDMTKNIISKNKNIISNKISWIK